MFIDNQTHTREREREEGAAAQVEVALRRVHSRKQKLFRLKVEHGVDATALHLTAVRLEPAATTAVRISSKAHAASTASPFRFHHVLFNFPHVGGNRAFI